MSIKLYDTVIKGFLISAIVLINATHSLAYEQCAYIHLDRNYALSNETINGTLYTNGCHSLNSVIVLGIYKTDGTALTEVMLKTKQHLTPFTLRIPKNSDENVYKIIAYTHKGNRLIGAMDLPVFSSEIDLIHKDSLLEIAVESPFSKRISGNLSLTLSEEQVSSERMVSLKLKCTNPGIDKLDLSIGLKDQAQCIEDLNFNGSYTHYNSSYSKPYPISEKESADKSSANTFKIEGHVKSRNQTTCSYCDVILTVPEISSGIFYSKTDINGKFTLSGLNFEGVHKGYFTYHSQMSDTMQYQLVLDIGNLPFPVPKVELKLQEIKDQFSSSIQRRRLATHFRSKNAIPDEHKSLTTVKRAHEKNKLYGQFDKELFFDDYILQDNMIDVIDKLIPKVSITKSGQLQMFSIELKKNFEGVPLILLDGIPVHTSSVLALNPKSLYKVEILNKVRTLANIGNAARYGVLSFFTKSGVDESSLGNIKKVYLNGFSSKWLPDNTNDQISFLQPVIYWNPHVSTGWEKTELTLNIKIPDYYFQPIMSIRGYDNKGNFVFHEEQIALPQQQ
ncbi:hypothetical protein FNH22_02470 [Fulvivirga sp. M361]|uniref:hypothetical protein n=1 Tax=Fulvivirga sp. M361 TaxID=2594266 RepID=UPI00117B5951|nr:hypothetical protein [Fulvivirga sp. M361]TRX62204.1 hypothetical protein FNH22_02470 [Fulvivirga sp. M361]